MQGSHDAYMKTSTAQCQISVYVLQPQNGSEKGINRQSVLVLQTKQAKHYHKKMISTFCSTDIGSYVSLLVV